MRGSHTFLTMLFALSIALSPAPLNNTAAAQRPPSRHASPRQLSRVKGLFKAEAGARTYFDAARRLLRGKGVPFDPDALRHPQWRKNLAEVFERMPEMRITRWGGDKLAGLYVAHTLYLPEQVETTGDTLILVRNLIHEGRNVLIKGSGNLYVFPVERVGLLGMTMREAFKEPGSRFTKVGHGSPPVGDALPTLIRDGGITIDHSVYGVAATGDEGAPGAPAADATPIVAQRGADGVCGVNNHGTVGSPAGEGGTGNKGGTAFKGVRGGNAANITYNIPAGAAGTWTFLANGGRGGQGGTGGPGSPGGTGAVGGSGGDGADCACEQGGAGSGGDAQNGGVGGRGGEGGDGGPGGTGGEAGQINVTYESQSDRPGSIITSSHGGPGGAQGRPGPPGPPGAGAAGGVGGRGATNTRCPSSASRNGRDGLAVGGLGFGPHGRPGDEGEEGAPRFPSITPRNSATADAGGCQPATGYACGDYSEAGAGAGCYPGGSGGCAGYSPVLIDVEGDGFRLTDGAGGVAFDLNGDGRRERLSWTSPDSDDAWLALDRDGDGMINDGRELFGNYTWQQITPAPNGFLALKEFDYPVWGGGGSDARGDGVIDSADGVFSLLMLWRDANHNGVSEPGELRPLASSGVSAIHLAYRESKREDEHGNKFRYRARVGGAKGSPAGRWAWDVFLVPAL